MEEDIAESLHNFLFFSQPVVQRDLNMVSSGEPHFLRPLLDLCLCPEVFSHRQDNRRWEVRINQLNAFSATHMATRFLLAFVGRLMGVRLECFLWVRIGQ
jgi:hypothetical protein